MRTSIKTALAVTLLTSAFTVHASDTLTPKSEWAFQALLLVDALQTRDIAVNPGRWHETNPIIGWHPSEARVDAYFLGAAIAHYAVTRILIDTNAPNVVQAVWQYSTIGVEAGCVANNIRWHVGFKF